MSDLRSPLEGRGTDAANGRMPAPLVIEHFDVVEQRHLRVAVAGERVGELVLDGVKASYGTSTPPGRDAANAFMLSPEWRMAESGMNRSWSSNAEGRIP